jgi:hypothetical protein
MEFSIVWFAFGLFTGVVVGTVTMVLMTAASNEDDVKDMVLHEIRREWFMQRLYQITLEVKGESQQERLEEYRKMVGCQRCDRTIQD